MARIGGVSARKAGLRVKLTYRFARRSIARLTGRQPDRMLEPLELYAHAPGLLLGYAMLEWATAKLHRLDDRLKNLAELQAAPLTQFEHCIALCSHVAGRSGLSAVQLLGMRADQTSA